MKPLLVFGLVGAAATIITIIVWRRKRGRKRFSGLGGGQVSCQAWREVSVPRRAVGIVIGRQGTNIKHIQELTNTRIHCLDEKSSESQRTFKIRGLDGNVEMANQYLMRIVASVPEVKQALVKVKQKHIGCIIGRQGMQVKELRQLSGCQIDMVDGDSVNREATRLVSLRGSVEQLQIGQYLVLLLTSDEEKYKRVVQRVSEQLSALDVDKYEVRGRFAMLGNIFPKEKGRIARQECIVESLGEETIREQQIEIETEEYWDDVDQI